MGNKREGEILTSVSVSEDEHGIRLAQVVDVLWPSQEMYIRRSSTGLHLIVQTFLSRHISGNGVKGFCWVNVRSVGGAPTAPASYLAPSTPVRFDV